MKKMTSLFDKWIYRRYYMFRNQDLDSFLNGTSKKLIPKPIIKIRNNFLLYFLFTLLVAGCANEEKSSLPSIDLSKNYELKKLSLQDIAQVRYIPLETDTTCLLNGRLPKCISKEYIIFVNKALGSILLFDHSGKIAHVIHRRGSGPEEYRSVGSVAFDEGTKELYCYLFYDHVLRVYGLDGTYVKTLPALYDGFVEDIYNYNDSLLFVWYNGTKNNSVYCVQSKHDSTYFQNLLTIPAEGKVSRDLIKRIPGGALGVQAPVTPLVFQNSRYLIADPTNDTIFRLTETQTFEPVFTRTPSIHTQDPYVALDYGLESKDYIFITAVELKYDFDTSEGLTQTPYLLEKKSGKIYRTQVTNRDYPDDPDYFCTANQLVSGRLVHYLLTEKLLEALENNQLSGQLKEIASTLNEDDNGVLMMIDLI